MTELDQALNRFCSCAPEFAGGLSNHGPMVAEALHALGHDALIAAWVDVYAPRLEEDEAGKVLPSPDRIAALGNGDFADWRATFREEVESSPWQRVARDWLPILLPGYFAGAMHGPIRAAHAIRALEEEDNEDRRNEFAGAFGYWAGGFRGLPGDPGASPRPGCGVQEVLAEVPVIDPARRAGGFLVDAVRVLDKEDAFSRVLAAADLAASEPIDQIARICAEVAGLYLRNPDARIAYIHALTGPAALRLLADYLGEVDLRKGAGFALQSAASLHATFFEDRAAAAPDPQQEELASSWDELRYRAACSLEEHVIKFTEACWREDRAHPHPVFALAAADAVLNLGVSRGGIGG